MARKSKFNTSVKSSTSARDVAHPKMAQDSRPMQAPSDSDQVIPTDRFQPPAIKLSLEDVGGKGVETPTITTLASASASNAEQGAALAPLLRAKSGADGVSPLFV